LVENYVFLSATAREPRTERKGRSLNKGERLIQRNSILEKLKHVRYYKNLVRPQGLPQGKNTSWLEEGKRGWVLFNGDVRGTAYVYKTGK